MTTTTALQALHALHEAVAAIHLGDGSDYESALRMVVHHLDPEVCKLLESDSSAAYELTFKRAEAAALSAPAQDAQADLIGDCIASECAARTQPATPAPAPVDAAATAPVYAPMPNMTDLWQVLDEWVDADDSTLQEEARGAVEAMLQDYAEATCRLRAAPSATPPAAPQAGEKYDDVLLPFLTLMRRELHANSGKGDRQGWLAMSPDTALLEVYYHLGKLQKAVRNNDGPAIQEHSADVANMAMMVLDVCGGLALVEAATAAPQAVPLTDAQIKRGWAAVSLHPHVDARFIEGVRFAERHHGITPAATKEQSK